jgi:hypothetical protein
MRHQQYGRSPSHTHPPAPAPAPRDCALSGSIPSELPAAWRALKAVAMRGNMLSGPLPGNWAPSLEALDLQCVPLGPAWGRPGASRGCP